MHKMKRIWQFVTLFGIVIFISLLVGVYIGDSALAEGKQVVIPTPEGESLMGTLYPGRNHPEHWGVIMLSGFGSDQVTMRSAANEFTKLGPVITFDFSGHGRSPGGLEFNNAQTNRLALQTLAAKDEFVKLTGIPADHILLLGHSLGARVALQASTMDENPPAGLILLGTQVNLVTNVQSEFFTGVQDNELNWIQSLGPSMPRTNILMISGSWDDILTPTAARLLYTRLAGMDVIEATKSGSLLDGTARELIILDDLLHNYEVFSPRVLAYALGWSQTLAGRGETLDVPYQARFRIWGWVLGFAALIISLMGANHWAIDRLSMQEREKCQIGITDLRRFLKWKIFLWFFSIPLMGIVSGIVFLIPLNKPVFNVYYLGFIGGYGVLMWFLYLLGRMPGTTGKLSLKRLTVLPSNGKLIFGFVIFISLLIFMMVYARTGWFYVFPLNQRLLWLFIMVPVTTLGFWIGNQEVVFVSGFDGKYSRIHLVLSLIGLFPFFLYIGFLAALGSISGVVGGLQGLLILLVVLLSGSLLQKLWKQSLLTAIAQAILLYWLVLPQGVLFQ